MGRNHRTWGMGAVVLLAFILAAPVRVMGAKTNQFGQHPGQLKDGAGGEAS